MSFTGEPPMRPESKSRRLLSITQAKAKMYEYEVPEQYHIRITRNPANLFPLAVGLLGDLAARANSQDVDENYQNDLRENLHFSAQFFDNFLHSHLEEELDPYLLLLGAASYYLRDLPGSSLVLAKRLGETCPDLGCLGLEDLLLWLLQGDFSTYFDGSDGLYGKHIDGISKWMAHYFGHGSEQDRLFEVAMSLRRIAYNVGTPRQLLFADVIFAIVKKRFENSTWYSLPRYSDLSADHWRDILQKETFIRELWPAQHLLGEHSVFRGKSAVVQMPTSAGKTKATEIIIRSAFLASRTSLAVIVAPFRALCHEIRNSLTESFRNESTRVEELSDVLQVDFEIMGLWDFAGRTLVRCHI
jgi:POLQ-like helicase